MKLHGVGEKHHFMCGSGWHCTKNEVFQNLRIWSHLLKKSLIENFIFCAMDGTTVL